MTTFYSIHAYDQESRHHAEEDKVDNGKLYATFERACDEIEKRIRAQLEPSDVYESPNREELKQKLHTYVHWPYSSLDGRWLWVISKWEVDT